MPDYIIADISLAEDGEMSISMAESTMPAIQALKSRFGSNKPLSGCNIACCINIAPPAAVMLRTLQFLGASLRVCSCSRSLVDDHVAAALAAGNKDSDPIPIYAWHRMTEKDFWWCIGRSMVKCENDELILQRKLAKMVEDEVQALDISSSMPSLHFDQPLLPSSMDVIIDDDDDEMEDGDDKIAGQEEEDLSMLLTIPTSGRKSGPDTSRSISGAPGGSSDLSSPKTEEEDDDRARERQKASTDHIVSAVVSHLESLPSAVTTSDVTTSDITIAVDGTAGTVTAGTITDAATGAVSVSYSHHSTSSSAVSTSIHTPPTASVDTSSSKHHQQQHQQQQQHHQHKEEAQQHHHHSRTTSSKSRSHHQSIPHKSITHHAPNPIKDDADSEEGESVFNSRGTASMEPSSASGTPSYRSERYDGKCEYHGTDGPYGTGHTGGGTTSCGLSSDQACRLDRMHTGKCTRGGYTWTPHLVLDGSGDGYMALHRAGGRAMHNLISVLPVATPAEARILTIAYTGNLKTSAFNVPSSILLKNLSPSLNAKEILMMSIKKARPDMCVAGSGACVVGYGRVGKAVSKALRESGARVTVVEIDPICALQASMSGFLVKPFAEALKDCLIVVTCTGCKNVLTKRHFEKLKCGCLIVNMGTILGEVDTSSLKQMHVKSHVTGLAGVPAAVVDGTRMQRMCEQEDCSALNDAVAAAVDGGELEEKAVTSALLLKGNKGSKKWQTLQPSPHLHSAQGQTWISRLFGTVGHSSAGGSDGKKRKNKRKGLMSFFGSSSSRLHPISGSHSGSSSSSHSSFGRLKHDPLGSLHHLKMIP
ncbi:Adenosylhomocysteinase-like protein, partial [Aduncisulcus paluster]